MLDMDSEEKHSKEKDDGLHMEVETDIKQCHTKGKQKAHVFVVYVKVFHLFPADKGLVDI